MKTKINNGLDKNNKTENVLDKKTKTKNVLDKKVFLVQTDTTVGFLSQDHQALAQLKERKIDKPFVTVTSSFKTLKTLSRVPAKHKNRIRRSKKTTFVYSNNRAIRVVKDLKHAKFIKPFSWFYSTSANEKGLSYNKDFAFMKSDIIVEDLQGLYEGESSSIYRLNRQKLQRLR
jgi:tRNA A37 threonylcarbamoyladenosine synthetase subunit TsaC/SUA5/YrdC